MAAYDLEEQEQLSAIKEWWNRHGNRITTVLLVTALAVLGFQGWRLYQRNQAEQASVLYGNLVLAINKQDKEAVKSVSGRLISEYGGTVQAHMAALLSAGVAVEGNDLKSAKAKYQFVVDKAKDALVRDAARLRLAALMRDEKAYDQALKLLQATPNEAFAARFEDMRGDLHAAKGAREDARKAYNRAVELLGKSNSEAPYLRDLIVLKLEALGEA